MYGFPAVILGRSLYVVSIIVQLYCKKIVKDILDITDITENNILALAMLLDLLKVYNLLNQEFL